jgi:hypothetical protein
MAGTKGAQGGFRALHLYQRTHHLVGVIKPKTNNCQYKEGCDKSNL